MKPESRLILARMLARDGKTVPEIHRWLEMIEQRPLSDPEWAAVREFIK